MDLSKDRAVAKVVRSPAELRALLAQSIIGVLEGRVNVAQANAIVGLATELHKSIRQEWDMRCYVAETIMLDRAQVSRMPAPLAADDVDGVDGEFFSAADVAIE